MIKSSAFPHLAGGSPLHRAHLKFLLMSMTIKTLLSWLFGRFDEGGKQRSMVRRRTKSERRFAFAAIIGSCGVVPLALVAWRVSTLPEQPALLARARVVAITPAAGRLYADRDDIDLRNQHGFGHFRRRNNQVRCKVGDEVDVEQRGITLTPVASTCK
jgi:hypothetical protein